MDLGLTGKVAIVTGAGQGIGRQIAKTLAAEGARVAVNDVVAERAQAVADEIKVVGGEAIGVAADITDLDSANAMVQQVIDALGRVDILVNNAGTARDVAFAESGKANWDVAINLCLYGAMNCSRAVLPHMISQNSGRIVSIISDAGRVGEAGLVSYSAAKAGIVGFTKAVAKEVGRYTITANCVAPGATETETFLMGQQMMIARLGEEEAAKRRERMLRAYPVGRGLGRLGLPTDVADAVAFVASERAAFITGQTLPVNGGYSMI